MSLKILPPRAKIANTLHVRFILVLNCVDVFKRIFLLTGLSCYFPVGVTKIHHLLNESGNFLSRPEFQRKYGLSVDFLTYNGILAAILNVRKKSIFIQNLLMTVRNITLLPQTSPPKLLINVRAENPQTSECRKETSRTKSLDLSCL